MQKTLIGVWRRAVIAVMMAVSVSVSKAADNEVAVFITIGQSNADGSAMFDAAIDSVMRQWYESDKNTQLMKIWYRSCEVENQRANALGEAARWCRDGKVVDVEPGWLDLWYRNENTSGRTAMNMIHGYGSYSTGDSTDCAQGRRGMEGMFGRRFNESFPDKELYIVKLGVSGSFISSWANSADDTNWRYFFNNMFKPAIEDLLAQGKRPVLAGVWWMQGCADRSHTKDYYEESLLRLIDRCGQELGFSSPHIYIGQIIKPGESTEQPLASVGFGDGVREAQQAVAASRENVELVDTRNFLMQHEPALGGYIHFNHSGVNDIGQELACRVVNSFPESWSKFTTPGKWVEENGTLRFVPSVGQPSISYAREDDDIVATLVYPGFTETLRHGIK